MTELHSIYLSNSWGAEHDVAFNDIKTQLAESVKMDYPKPKHRFCLCTDASDTNWAAIFYQIPEKDQHKDFRKQEHEPLCFLSGAFTGSS